MTDRYDSALNALAKSIASAVAKALHEIAETEVPVGKKLADISTTILFPAAKIVDEFNHASSGHSLTDAKRILGIVSALTQGVADVAAEAVLGSRVVEGDVECDVVVTLSAGVRGADKIAPATEH